MKIEIGLYKKEDTLLGGGIFFILIWLSFVLVSEYLLLTNKLPEQIETPLSLFILIYPILLLIFSYFLTRIKFSITKL